MPTFKPKPSSDNNTGEPAPTSNKYEREYQSATASSRREPLANLLTNIEGYPWSVTYYQQVLGNDESPHPQEITLDETLQQYHKIHGMEFRVQSPLEYEYVKERGAHYLQGGAVITPGTIVPNRGDMFIADVGDGREAIFTLTDVTPMSYMLEKAYEIEYTSVSQVTSNRKEDLENKVVKTSHFVKDFLEHGQNPILSTDTVALKHKLDHHGSRLVEAWVHEFVSKRHRHILVPNQPEPTYDPFLVNFLRQYMDVSQYPVLRDANWPTHANLVGLHAISIWDLLLSPDAVDTHGFDERILKHCVPVTSKAAQGSPFLGGLYYQGIRRIIWPTETAQASSNYEWVEDPTRGQIPPVSDDSDAEPKPMIHGVLSDDYYVFSQAFYESNRPEMSWLEYRLTQVLAHEALPEQAVLELARSAYSWPDLERFYFTPVVLVLIQASTEQLNR